MSSLIEILTINSVYAIFIIFCRIAAIVMMIPGISESYVAPRVRLLLAISISFLIFPLLLELIPALPDSLVRLFLIIGVEILVGIFIGVIIKILINTMQIVGTIVSTQSSLGSAMLFDPNQGTQGTIISNFLTSLAVVLMFASDLHLIIFQGIFESYTLFPLATPPAIGDMAAAITKTVSHVFLLAIKISSPLLVIGFVIMLAGGILSRLMPGMQVFFVMVPIQILISFFILMTILSSIMMWFLEQVNDYLVNFLLGSI